MVRKIIRSEAIFTALAIAQKSIGRPVPIVKMPLGGALRRPDTLTAMPPKEFKRGH
jgi:hypothetical protein